MTSSHLPQRAAFSLVELLLVIAVILILTSMLIAVGSTIRTQAMTTTASRMVATLTTAMQNYRAEDMRKLFPTPNANHWLDRDPANPASVLMLLEYNSDALVTNSTKSAAFTVQPHLLDENGADPTYRCLMDPWGRPYCYLVDGGIMKNGRVDVSLLNGLPDRPLGVTAPDWNPGNVEPYAYIWSYGKPRNTDAADEDPSQVAHWVYQKSL